MSLPYIPLYIDDFEAHTAHLSLAEDGAYNRILRLMWRSPGCSIPDDDEWIFRRMRAFSDADKAVILSVIDEFCERKNGKVSSPRLTQEFKKADVTYRKRSAAGKKGGRPQAIENKGNDEKPGFVSEKAGLKQPEPEPELIKRDTNVSPKKRASRLSDDWELPEDFREWCHAEWPGIRDPFIASQADRFRDYWVSKAGKDAAKINWLATWRNWMRRAVEEAGRKSSQQRQREPVGSELFYQSAARDLRNANAEIGPDKVGDRENAGSFSFLSIADHRGDG